MLNVIGLLLAFIAAWLIAATFSLTATPENQQTLFVLIPLFAIAAAGCFYFANRKQKIKSA